MLPRAMLGSHRAGQDVTNVSTVLFFNFMLPDGQYTSQLLINVSSNQVLHFIEKKYIAHQNILPLQDYNAAGVRLSNLWASKASSLRASTSSSTSPTRVSPTVKQM